MRTYAIYIYEYIQPELAPPSHFHLRIQTLEVLRREVEGMALNVCHQLQDAGVKVATPLKFNMEPENQPLGKDCFSFGNHRFQVPAVKLLGGESLLFNGIPRMEA